MTLTSHLRKKESPIRKFFDARFPNTRKLLKETRARLENAPIVKPPENASSGALGTLGTAFELRARLYFTMNDLDAAVPPHVVTYLSTWPLDVTLNNVFQDLAIRHYKSDIQKSLSHPKNSDQEEKLVRYCIAFAWLEELYRNSVVVWRYSPLTKQKPKSLRALLAMPSSEFVNDVCRMIDLFEKQCPDWVQSQVILDAKLKGSSDIGGADPDIIWANQLIDFKAVHRIKAERFKRWIYQLIGYALLDYNDQYAISGLTLYFARYGVRISWPFPGVLTSISNGEPSPLSALKRDFKKAVARAKKFDGGW